MHELSLAESVLQVIEEAARHQGFTRVRTVWLEIGQLACVEPESLRFILEQATKGSIAEGARLEIVKVDGQGRCIRCQRAFPLPALHEPCPDCGSYQVDVTNGEQLRIRELEVE